MMTIGEFALCTGLSVKALRFYDERGLLTPADVDPYSGYRRYSASQLRTATTIRILRTAGLGVEDVRTALDEPDRLDELLRNHAADTARRRGLEDRAMELGRGLLKNGGDGDGKANDTRIQFRTMEATPWAAVVQRLHLDVDLSEVDAVVDQTEDQIEQLVDALHSAGIGPVGIGWTGLRPVNGSYAVVDQLVAVTVGEELPASFSVPGLTIETGTLPKREEAFVTMPIDGEFPDVLPDAPGGPLPMEEIIVLSEFLESRGIESPELRQRAVEDQAHDGADPETPALAEAAVTLRVLD